MAGVPVCFCPHAIVCVPHLRCCCPGCKALNMQLSCARFLSQVGSCLHVQGPQQPFGGPGQQQAQQMQWQAPGQVVAASFKVILWLRERFELFMGCAQAYRLLKQPNSFVTACLMAAANSRCSQSASQLPVQAHCCRRQTLQITQDGALHCTQAERDSLAWFHG